MNDEQGDNVIWTEQDLKHYKPGSFGCHELLDRTMLLTEMIEQQVLTHPACLMNPEWYALAEKAATSLNDLYQKIGARHLAEDSDSSHPPRIGDIYDD